MSDDPDQQLVEHRREMVAYAKRMIISGIYLLAITEGVEIPEDQFIDIGTGSLEIPGKFEVEVTLRGPLALDEEAEDGPSS